jgi:hypothetical protein
MSLPHKAIDRLFERLAATYGSAWTRMWADVPINDAKSAWAHELSGFESDLGSVAWALDNLPEKCMNVIEFRNLCRRAPTPQVPKLPEPQANPERIAAELLKLGEIKKNVMSPSSGGKDGRDWARRIMGRFDAGEKLNQTTLTFARQALGIQ